MTQGGYDGRGNTFHALKPDLRQMKRLFALVMPLLVSLGHAGGEGCLDLCRL